MQIYDVYYTDEKNKKTMVGSWNDLEIATQFAVDNYGVDPDDAELGEYHVAMWTAPDGEGTITITERTVDGPDDGP